MELFNPKDGSFSEEMRSNLRELIQRLSIILRVVNCKGKVDCDAFELYCKATYIHLLQTFWDEDTDSAWCSVPPSVHRQRNFCVLALDSNARWTWH